MITPEPDPSLLAITTTSDSRRLLEQIADQLIGERAAACCQIEGPITSVYRWQDRVESTQEYRLLIKTWEANWNRVVGIIRQQHNYDQPQIVGQRLDHVDAGYANWARQAVDTTGARPTTTGSDGPAQAPSE